jgi:hypothetical protein
MNDCFARQNAGGVQYCTPTALDSGFRLRGPGKTGLEGAVFEAMDAMSLMSGGMRSYQVSDAFHAAR